MNNSYSKKPVWCGEDLWVSHFYSEQKNHNKQNILVKISEFCFKTFSQTKLFLIMVVLIFSDLLSKKGELFPVF